jgi:hypothetical protein
MLMRRSGASMARLSAATIALLLLGACAAPPSPQRLALEHLLARQTEAGFFRYEFDFLTGRWSTRDNIVRQAGAAYALAEYLTRHDEPRVRVALRASLRGFASASVPWGDGWLLTQGHDPDRAKAGASALALLAGLWYRQVSDDPQFDDYLHAWRSGLLALRKPDGLFFSLPGGDRESPYSNGEIWLALAVFGEVFPADSRVRDVLPQLDQVVLQRYAEHADIGFFHWGLMAAAVRYRMTGDDRLAAFVSRQVQAYLDTLRPVPNPNANSCYAVEGMADGYRVLQAAGGAAGLRERLRQRIGEEMSRNLALQLPAGADHIPLGEGRRLSAPELAEFSGAFLNGRLRPQVRIDATQHCLSAMLKTGHPGGLVE